MGFTISLMAFEPQHEWKVGQIRFEGNHSLKSSELLSVMRLRSSGVFKKHKITEDRLSERLLSDFQSIEALYRFRGWYDAAVKGYELNRDSSSNKIRVTITIYENAQYVIGSLNFLSSDYENENFYRESARIFPGDPLDSALIEQGRINLTNALEELGHLFVSVIYHIDFPQKSADFADGADSIDSPDSKASPAGDVSYIIQRGPIAVAGGVEIFGLKHVKPKVVERDLQFDKGDVVTRTLVERSRKKLYTADLFSTVFIIPVDTLESYLDLDTAGAQIAVIVTEKEMAAAAGGAGYGAYMGWFVNLQFMYRNLFGLGHKVSVMGRYSHWERGGELSYLYPHLFGNFADGEARVYGERRLQSDYDGVFWGGRFSVFDRPIVPIFSWRGSIRAEHTSRISTDNPTHLYPGQSRRDTYALGAQLRSEQVLDNMNFLGWIADLRGELAGPFLQRTNQFYTVLSTLRLHYPVLTIANITAISRVQGAFGAGYGRSGHGLLPVQERFWVGFGPLVPVRGFNHHELMPKDESGDTRGAGAVLAFTPIELRIPVYWRIQGAAFVDVGHAWRNPGAINMEDLRTALGPGLILKTAQGVFRFDYGIQVPQGRSRFHFYIENF